MRPPAFTFDLIFIPAYSFFDVSVEPQHRVLGFKAGDRRPLPIKAIAQGKNLHGAEKYFRGDDQSGHPFPPSLVRGDERGQVIVIG
jgi:hypothetical protein